MALYSQRQKTKWGRNASGVKTPYPATLELEE
jgi:hypothetical protein